MAEHGRALDVKKSTALINYQGRTITITFDDVKRFICPKAMDQEVAVFLNIAQSLNLNPWAREIYLVKYGEEAASIIIAEEVYLKAAEQCDEFEGHEAGIILLDPAGNTKQVEGTLIVDEKDTLVGGWARVYRKDRKYPFFIAVDFKECAKHTKEGKLTHFWYSMPATMIRKVALSRALREAFPSRLGGTVTDAEWEDVTDQGKPKSFEKNGKPNWELFYAKIKDEFGLTAKQAHELLKVDHFGTLLEQGWTMEKIWDEIIKALGERGAVKSIEKSDQKVDKETGEILSEAKSFEDLPSMFDSKEKKTKSPGPGKSKRDIASIKTINDLLRACFEDFGLQPPDVYKELGYSSAQDINKMPADCYREIAEVRQPPPK